MSRRSYLTIRDFIKHGINFRTEIEDWHFRYRQALEGWSWIEPTSLEKPLTIKRKKDKYSTNFARLIFSRAMERNVKFPEATITIDETGQIGSLAKRTIYDFSDFEVISYTLLGTYEEISFDFAKASFFETSVEKIQSP